MKYSLAFVFSAFICSTACVLTSCESDLEFSSDASYRLSFSKDTINFDTLITNMSSSTRSFVVYNNNEKGVRLQKVNLKKGNKSPFKVNVDGVYLGGLPNNEGSGFEIMGSDSMRVFVEVLLPENQQDDLLEIQDTLNFEMESGRRHQVILKACGENATFLHGKVIECDTTFYNERPFVIYDSLYVASGATLTLTPGVRLMFHEKASLKIKGSVVAQGSLTNPVIMRGDRTDKMFDNLPYENAPNQWEGVKIDSTSYNNVFDYVDIHGSKFGIRAEGGGTDHTKFTMTNSVINNTASDGLYLRDVKTTISNSQISNALGDCVHLVSGHSTFIYCTIAQFYAWDSNRGFALYLTSKEGDFEKPLQQAHFLNCLITGYGSDEIMGNLSEGTDNKTNYLFSHSLLNTVKSDDERFEYVVYDNDDNERFHDTNFPKLMNENNYTYNFELDSLSPARGIADMKYVEVYPFDRCGVRRGMNQKSDAGCYEFISK